MQTIDSVIAADWIVPVEPADTLLEGHAVAIHEGRILDILPANEVGERYTPASRLELKEHILFPGLVNAHTHAAMALFRGLADDLPLMEWLNEHIWPAEGKWISDRFVRDGSRLALAEMVRGGTTCFNDMYFFADDTALVASEIGIRAVIGLIVVDFPTVWAKDADEYLNKGIAIHDVYRNDPLISTAFAPHAPYSVSDGPLERVGVLAEEMDIPIHMHIHETDDEIQGSLKQHGVRPIERLDGKGLLSPRLMAVHMTHLEGNEIERIAACGASVVHCPESNMKLASGFCPVQALTDKGINVALGTDGAASNNDLDMLGEARSAALLGKAVATSASALSAESALRMATLNGAKALGLDSHIGSLEPGKSADMVAVDLGDMGTQPVYHPVSQLIYAASRHQVRHVWVAGRHLVMEGRLTSVDEGEVTAQAREWRDRIRQYA